MTPANVHLGLGAFARSFVVPWVADAPDGGDWGIIGVSLRSPDVRDALQPQGWAYHAVELGPKGMTPRPVRQLVNVLVAPEDPAAVLDQMAHEATRIVSLTITEKGYCHDPATGRLRLDHADIAHDLTGGLPRSAIGFLVRALQLRRQAGVAPFTVLCCDNLPDNGAMLRGLVLEFAQVADAGLADWIAAEVAFPCTMVDRITPATTLEDVAEVAEMSGIPDAAPVMHEPFRQWVIEDHFTMGRPDLGAVGVQLVRDVAPYELMKLRMLNGAHSALSYLGYLAGHRYVCDALADPVMAGFLQRLWAREIIPTLTPPEGMDLKGYGRDLRVRFENPAIRHQTWQIAMDGSQKLPQRLLGTLRDALDAGGPHEGLLLAVAGWMRYVGGVDDAGQPIDVRDPLADRLRELAGAERPVSAILGMREVFDVELAARIETPLTTIYDALKRDGASAALGKVMR